MLFTNFPPNFRRPKTSRRPFLWGKNKDVMIIMNISNFTITPFRFGVVVLFNGKFWETADSYNEAKRDIEFFLRKESFQCEKT